MLPTTIRSPPSLEDYTPIEEHQSQTPENFFGGKPVLHHHLEGVKAWIPASQKGSLAVFPADISTAATAPNGTTLKDLSEELVEQEVSVFVNSENFIIFSSTSGAGVSIPYPSISIHAVKQVGSITEETPLQAIWMQLELSDGGDGGDDDDFNTIDLTLVPAVTAGGAQADVQKLYDAISACSDLHPDPVDEDEDEDDGGRIIFEGEHEPLDGYTGVMHGASDGGLPPAFPGSGGWITAENVHEHFDADGNYIGSRNGGAGEDEEDGGELGEGAGRVRGHDEVNGGGINGHEDSENKRPRVDEP